MAELLLLGDHPGQVLDGQVEAIGLDTETTGLKWNDKIIGISMAWRDGEGYKSCYLLDPSGTGQLPMWGVNGVIQAGDLMLAVPKLQTVVFANHPFDFRFLFKQFGLQPLTNVIEIQHVAKHLGAQAFGVSLAALYGKYVGPVKREYAALKGKRAILTSMDAESVAVYAREDALATLKVYESFRGATTISLYKKNHLWDQKFMWLVMELVKRGLPLDTDYINTKIHEYRGRMILLGIKLVSLGIANPSYPPDVMGFCKSRNIPLSNTQFEELEKYGAEYPELAGVIEYRQLSKALGSWLEIFDDYGRWDGSLHSRLDPFGTRSFRMSAQDPNAQGIPMEERGERAFGSMFGVFKSDRPGQVLFGLDMKQAELRLAAVLSRDPDMLAAVADTSIDPYVALSELIWHTKGKRQMAKKAQLSAIYEVGVTKFAHTNNISDEEAAAVLQAVRARFPTAMRNARAMARTTERTGRVDLITGRPRWIQQDEVGHEYKAFNQFVQGSLAEIMRGTMLKVEDVLPDRLVLQVHDSIVMYMDDDPDVRGDETNIVQMCLNETVAELLAAYDPIVFPIEPKPYQVMDAAMQGA